MERSKTRPGNYSRLDTINQGERRLRTTRKQNYAAILRTLQVCLAKDCSVLPALDADFTDKKLLHLCRFQLFCFIRLKRRHRMFNLLLYKNYHYFFSFLQTLLLMLCAIRLFFQRICAAPLPLFRCYSFRNLYITEPVAQYIYPLVTLLPASAFLFFLNKGIIWCTALATLVDVIDIWFWGTCNFSTSSGAPLLCCYFPTVALHVVQMFLLSYTRLMAKCRYCSENKTKIFYTGLSLFRCNLTPGS